MPIIDQELFWQWAYSDFLSNTLRGVLAEYLVSTALECESSSRVEWDAFDLITKGGVEIEVKSSAYLQTWKQARPSEIRFDIAMKKQLVAETNSYSSCVSRPAGLYVFCVFSAKERRGANPLDTTQWFFIVCSTHKLEEYFGKQKTVGLASLESIGLSRLNYEQLLEAVDEIQC